MQQVPFNIIKRKKIKIESASKGKILFLQLFYITVITFNEMAVYRMEVFCGSVSCTVFQQVF